MVITPCKTGSYAARRISGGARAAILCGADVFEQNPYLRYNRKPCSGSPGTVVMRTFLPEALICFREIPTTMPSTLIIGTRGSELALKQAHSVRSALLSVHPRLDVQLRVIRTTGDAVNNNRLTDIPGKGLFTRQIERQLLEGGIHLAVHSLKDLPIALPPGLCLGAIPLRLDAVDALVTKTGANLTELASGATILAGSARRSSQLRHQRPDLHIRSIRGNVTTRLAKFDQTDAAAIVLAAAGLIRLGLQDRITQRFAAQQFLPAAGQGALAVQIRSDDARTAELVAVIDDPDTRKATTAERALLARLHGGCHLPIGAYAEVGHDQLVLYAMIAKLDGSERIATSLTGPTQCSEQLGRRVADKLLELGGREIITAISAQTNPPTARQEQF